MVAGLVHCVHHLTCMLTNNMHFICYCYPKYECHPYNQYSLLSPHTPQLLPSFPTHITTAPFLHTQYHCSPPSLPISSQLPTYPVHTTTAPSFPEPYRQSSLPLPCTPPPLLPPILTYTTTTPFVLHQHCHSPLPCLSPLPHSSLYDHHHHSFVVSA